MRRKEAERLKDEQLAELDLVDRIFEYLQPHLPELEEDTLLELKQAVRAEFRGGDAYIAGRPRTERQQRVQQVLSLFNGRNAREVARRLSISRATVYRTLKQAGRERNSLIFPGNETAPAVACDPSPPVADPVASPTTAIAS